MGYLYRTYECDNGGEGEPHQFEVMVKADEHPNFCPTCGNPIGEIRVIPGTKNIGKSNINKAVDMVYRTLEENSQDRADITGNPNFKITNMKDNLREGDVAAMPIRNTVTGFMDDAATKGVNYGWGGGSVGTPAFNSAPMPIQRNPETGFTGPGHESLSAIQGAAGQSHLGNRALMAAAGQINKPNAG